MGCRKEEIITSPLESGQNQEVFATAYHLFFKILPLLQLHNKDCERPVGSKIVQLCLIHDFPNAVFVDCIPWGILGGLLSVMQPAFSFILRFMPSLPFLPTFPVLSWFLVHRSCPGRATWTLISSPSASGRGSFSLSWSPQSFIEPFSLTRVIS